MSLLEIIDPAYMKAKLDAIDTDLDAIPALSAKFPDAVVLGDTFANPTTTRIGGCLLGWDNVAGVWERIYTDGSNRLLINAPVISGTALNVALDTRASETTLSGFSGKFPTAVALGDTLSNPTTTLIGGALLGWDSAAGVWERLYTDGSNRLLINAPVISGTALNVALDTRASETTLSGFSGKFPSAVALGDTLSNPTTTLIGGALLGWDSAAGVWERLHTDGSNRLLINAPIISGTALNVALDTRASETTLSTFSGKFPTATELSDALTHAPTTTIIGGAALLSDGVNLRRARMGESVSLVPSAARTASGHSGDLVLAAPHGTLLLCLDVTAVSGTGPTLDVRVEVKDDVSGKYVTVMEFPRVTAVGTFWRPLPTIYSGGRTIRIAWTIGGTTPSFTFSVGALSKPVPNAESPINRQPYYGELSATTTESSVAFAAPGLMCVSLINRGDNDINVRVISPIGTLIRIPARCGKIIPFSFITGIWYATVAGTSTLVVNGWY